MNITLDSETPSFAQTGLTAGGNYSVWHTGNIIISAEIGGTVRSVFRSDQHAGIVLTGIPATALTFSLADGCAAAEIELNRLS